jgi:putative FmdB family regulatory protein
MPLYSFECEGCRRTKDVPLRLSELDNPTRYPKCPTCLQFSYMQRVPTSASLNFKGSGWTPKHY